MDTYIKNSIIAINVVIEMGQLCQPNFHYNSKWATKYRSKSAFYLVIETWEDKGINESVYPCTQSVGSTSLPYTLIHYIWVPPWASCLLPFAPEQHSFVNVLQFTVFVKGLSS